MNILFFLKPKSEVAYVHDYGTLRQVLETMEYHKYASIPMLNKSGEYVGTITEGDLLWGIKRYTDIDFYIWVRTKISYNARIAFLKSSCLTPIMIFNSLDP